MEGTKGLIVDTVGALRLAFAICLQAWRDGVAGDAAAAEYLRSAFAESVREVVEDDYSLLACFRQVPVSKSSASSCVPARAGRSKGGGVLGGNR